MNKLLFLILSLFFSLIAFSQTGLNLTMKEVSNPTPEAAKLTNYFFVPVNTSTGNVSLSIPIYTIQEDGVSIPISLSYHTGGIRVTDLSGSVGLGWSLNAGGGIFRSINGLPDENASGFPSTFLNPAIDLYDYSVDKPVNVYSSYYVQTVLQSLNTAQYDMNQDDYTYSFLDKSGSIYFNFEKKFKEGINSNITFSYDNTALGTLSATDRDGIIYHFSEKERTATTHTTTPIGYPASATVSGTTAWKLSSIQTINGKSINFSYGDYATDINYPSGNSMSLMIRQTGATCYHMPQTAVSSSQTRVISYAKLINTISTENVLVKFYYSDLSSASNWKRKLDKVEVLNNRTSEVLRTVEFTYSVFSGDPRLKLDYVRLKDKNLVKVNEYALTYRSAQLPTILSLGKDLFGFYNGASNTTLLKAPGTGYYVGESLYNADRSVNSINLQIGTLTEIKYPTGGKTKLYYEPNLVDGVRYGPGLRISKVEQYDQTNLKVNTKDFEYYDLTGRSTTFPDYAIRRVPIVHPSFGFSSATWGVHSETTTVLSELPKNFFYGKVVTKEKGADGNDAILVDFYADLNDDGDHAGMMLNNGYYKPQLVKKEFYKNSYLPANKIKDIVYKYSIFNNSVDESVIYKLQPAVLSNLEWPDGFRSCFNMYLTGLEKMYRLRSNWIVKDWDEETDYLGGTSVTIRTEYTYNNNKHYFPSQIKIFSSNGESKIVNRKYPLDFNVGITPTEEVAKGIRVLQQRNVISPIIEEWVQINNASTGLRTVASTFNKYKPTRPLVDITYSAKLDNSVANFVPVTITATSSTKDSRYEARNIYTLYDVYGNLLELQKVNNMKISYEWGYNNTYNVVEVKNAQNTPETYSDQPFNSSLALTTGQNSATASLTTHVVGTISLNLDANPGKTYSLEYSLVGPVVRSGTLCVSSSSTACQSNHASSATFNDMPSGTYTLYLYYYGSDPDVYRRVTYSYVRRQISTPAIKEFYYNGFEAESGPNIFTTSPFAGKKYYNGDYQVQHTGASGRSYLVNYRYLEGGIWKGKTKAFSNNMTLTDGTAIDEVRVFPTDALMTTYTHEPLVGVTSQTDPTGKTLKYTYDSFGRLKEVRDQDNNLIKNMDYQYQKPNNQ